MSHLSFYQFWHFSTIFEQIRIDLSGNTANVNVTRFARYVELDFFMIFKHCEHCCFLLSAIQKGKLQSYFSIDSNFPSLYDAIIFEHMYMCDNFPKC